MIKFGYSLQGTLKVTEDRIFYLHQGSSLCRRLLTSQNLDHLVGKTPIIWFDESYPSTDERFHSDLIVRRIEEKVSFDISLLDLDGGDGAEIILNHPDPASRDESLERQGNNSLEDLGPVLRCYTEGGYASNAFAIRDIVDFIKKNFPDELK